MAKTKIEWTEKSWNPVTGCTKVSAGCKNCYAEVIAKRFWKDRKFTDLTLHTDRLEQPLHWRKPSMIFVNSMSDLFHESVEFWFIDTVFATIELKPQHIFQILTKRPERAIKYFEWRLSQYPQTYDNVWQGVSVENDNEKHRIETLKQIPAAVKWVSFEPLIGRINYLDLKGIDWVVVGAESGHGARSMDLDWARDIKFYADKYKIPFFMKQICKNGHKIPFNEFPNDLQIREYPQGVING